MKLIDFLEREGKEAELESLREKPDRERTVRASAVHRINHQLRWIIGMLDDLYEVKENEDGSIELIKKDETQ